MDLINLIRHPELMDRETLYDLRSLIAQYPYYQTARLLMLKNLYILHDPTFDEELRRAAIYITDRKVIFNLVESAHYQLKTTEKTADEKGTATCEHKDCGHKDCSENHKQCEGEHKSCDGNKQCEGESKNCSGNKQCQSENKSCCGNKQCEGEHKK